MSAVEQSDMGVGAGERADGRNGEPSVGQAPQATLPNQAPLSHPPPLQAPPLPLSGHDEIHAPTPPSFPPPFPLNAPSSHPLAPAVPHPPSSAPPPRAIPVQAHPLHSMQATAPQPPPRLPPKQSFQPSAPQDSINPQAPAPPGRDAQESERQEKKQTGGLGGGPLARAGPAGLFDEAPRVHTSSPIAKSVKEQQPLAPPRSTPLTPSPPSGAPTAQIPLPAPPTHPLAPPPTHPLAPPPTHPLAPPPTHPLAPPASHPLAAPAIHQVARDDVGRGEEGGGVGGGGEGGGGEQVAVDPEVQAEQFLGRQVNRPTPRRASATLSGLAELARAGQWRLLLSTSAEMLSPKAGEKLSRQYRFQIAAYRIAAHLQTRSVRAAMDELSRLGPLGDPMLAEHPPFIMYILEAEVFSTSGQKHKAQELLFSLLGALQVKMNRQGEEEEEGGEERKSNEEEFQEKVLSEEGGDEKSGLSGEEANQDGRGRGREEEEEEDNIAMLLDSQQDIRKIPLALLHTSVLSSLLRLLIDQGDYLTCVHILESHARAGDQTLLWSLVRVHITFGNVQAAEKLLSEMKEEEVSPSKLLLHRALLALSKNLPSSACDLLEKALELEPGNLKLINNLAVAQLYNKQVSKGISLLEDAIRRDPVGSLSYHTIFNLCSLYDLQGTDSQHKKKIVNVLAKRLGAEDLDLSACKL